MQGSKRLCPRHSTQRVGEGNDAMNGGSEKKHRKAETNMGRGLHIYYSKFARDHC